MRPEPSTDYSAWDTASLVERVKALEAQLRAQSASFTEAQSLPQRPRSSKSFDPSKYATRFIALKFAYLGQRYNGYEHHLNNTTPLPTIEEVLWKALAKTKLIFQDENGGINWDGCEYSKCGRTDKGVSAFGQVIGIRVRSARPKLRKLKVAVDEHEETEVLHEAEDSPFDDINDELPYPRILNRVLPPDIRILAWCPSPPPDFSARFSCRERRYRYFFTQPAYIPHPGPEGIVESAVGRSRRRGGWLDIEAMQEGAAMFLGNQDFRNFCKLDASKQLTSFERIIRKSEVRTVEPHDVPALGYLLRPDMQPTSSISETEKPQVYCFEVHGSAFLWHQIRHMVGILFLIGQGLERPDIVRTLLDVEKNPAKPVYDMADDAPLVLWDCIFPSPDGPSSEDSLRWIYPEDQVEPGDGERKIRLGTGDGRHGATGLNEVLWAGWRRAKMDEILAASLLDLVASQGNTASDSGRNGHNGGQDRQLPLPRIFHGGNDARVKGPYIPILERRRMEVPAVINQRYLERKGMNVNESGVSAQAEVDE